MMPSTINTYIFFKKLPIYEDLYIFLIAYLKVLWVKPPKKGQFRRLIFEFIFKTCGHCRTPIHFTLAVLQTRLQDLQ